MEKGTAEEEEAKLCGKIRVNSVGVGKYVDRDQKWHRDPKTTQTPSPGPQNHHAKDGSRPENYLNI